VVRAIAYPGRTELGYTVPFHGGTEAGDVLRHMAAAGPARTGQGGGTSPPAGRTAPGGTRSLWRAHGILRVARRSGHQRPSASPGRRSRTCGWSWPTALRSTCR